MSCLRQCVLYLCVQLQHPVFSQERVEQKLVGSRAQKRPLERRHVQVGGLWVAQTPLGQEQAQSWECAAVSNVTNCGLISLWVTALPGATEKLLGHFCCLYPRDWPQWLPICSCLWSAGRVLRAQLLGLCQLGWRSWPAVSSDGDQVDQQCLV